MIVSIPRVPNPYSFTHYKGNCCANGSFQKRPTMGEKLILSKGHLFLADSESSMIKVFSEDGKLVRQWGKKGNKSGKFHSLSGIAISDDTLYAVDSKRVQAFTLQGNFLFQCRVDDSVEDEDVCDLTFGDICALG